jgi:diacylglycerol kinase (ATP)
MKHALIVFNPASGAGEAESILSDLLDRLQREGWGTRTHQTVDQGNLSEAVHALLLDLANPIDLVVVLGGDGTVSAVGNALLGTDIPLAIVPAGTGNVLARSLGIPLVPAKSILLIVGGHTMMELDGMQVGQSCHFLNISIGFTAAVIHTTKSRDKRWFGFLAYVGAALARLLGVRQRRFHLALDGAESQPLATDIVFMNNAFVGFPRLRLGPEARLDDGVVEAYIFRARTLLDYFWLLGHILSGRQRRDRNLTWQQVTDSVRVDAISPLPVQADGDPLGSTPVEIRVRHKAIRVMVPKKQ